MVKWQYARTMPQYPHEYTIRDWNPALIPTFRAFVMLIRATGTVVPWPAPPKKARYNFEYLPIDGWKYWSMGYPVEETTVINRALLETDPL